MLIGVSTWEGIQEWRSNPYGGSGPVTLLLPIAWCLLIARVIHAEALPGDRHFWLTHPYSRTGLLLSKAMFILAFINIPLLIAQAMILSLDGFPLSSYLGGLLWNQLMITAVVLLPAATVAALTRNLAQFVPAAVLAAAVILPPIAERRIQPEWFGALLGVGIAGAIGGTILVGEGGAEVAPQTPEQPIKLVVREPVGFFRYQMEVPNVRLSQYAVMETRSNQE